MALQNQIIILPSLRVARLADIASVRVYARASLVASLSDWMVVAFAMLCRVDLRRGAALVSYMSGASSSAAVAILEYVVLFSESSFL